MASSQFVVAGDGLTPESFPKQNSKRSLTLGPGLQYLPPSSVQATSAGYVNADNRKNALWVESNGMGRYVPNAGDLVIVTVHHSSMEAWLCAITRHAPLASLSQLAFEGASKKTKPNLQPGSLIYARVASANRHMDPELECVHPSTGKSEGLGELKGGMAFDISLGLARRLLMSKTVEEGRISALEELGQKGLRFEIAVGRNGRVWVNSDEISTIITIGSAIKEIDEKDLTVDQQSNLVKKLTKPT